MKIVSVEYSKSVGRIEDLPRDRLPQIAFAGRSNVGKSTLLNVLINKHRLAYVSSTPGKTQTLNFYLVNHNFYLVDLPGYGYARSPMTLRQAWQGLIESYLNDAAKLKLVVVLVDVRHALSPLDAQLLEWLQAREQPYAVVATKADKLSGTDLHKNLAALRAASPALQELVAFSAKTGRGKEDIWRLMRRVLQEAE